MSGSWGLPVFRRSQIKTLASRLTNLLQILWFFQSLQENAGIVFQIGP